MEWNMEPGFCKRQKEIKIMKMGKLMNSRQISHLLAQRGGQLELCSAFHKWVLVFPGWFTFSFFIKLDVNFASSKMHWMACQGCKLNCVRN